MTMSHIELWRLLESSALFSDFDKKAELIIVSIFRGSFLLEQSQ